MSFMRKKTFGILYIIALMLFAQPSGPGLAASSSGGEPSPVSPPTPGTTAPLAVEATTPQAITVPTRLKAVLIVGPDAPAATAGNISLMDNAAAALTSRGVQVVKFYTPNNDWTQVKAAAQGANFLFYRGHGIYWPNANYYGGLYLGDGSANYFVSPFTSGASTDPSIYDLHLARNAVVMIFSCYSAGSGTETQIITNTEAIQRVSDYAQPFLAQGGAGYYANWYPNAFENLVGFLFQGYTLGETYDLFNGASPTVERYANPVLSSDALWLDKDDIAGTLYYDAAFTGHAGQSLTDLFTTMRIYNKNVLWLSTPKELSMTIPVGVYSSTGEAFPWNASLAGTSGPDTGWITLSATSGSSGGSLLVTVQPQGKPLGVYTASIHVQAGLPALLNYDQTFTVTLDVVTQDTHIYLPAIDH